MAYKDDLNALREQHARLKKYREIVGKSIKITVIALAVALLCTLTLVIVDIVTDKPSANSDSDADSAPAPVITLKSGDAIYMYVGENVTLRDAVVVTDSSGECKLEIDNSKLNPDVVGTYEVVYIATNSSGRSTRYTVKVVVAKKEYSKGVLMQKIGALAEQLYMSPSMTKKELAKAIYSYAHNQSNISYAGYSNIPNINRSNWKTDWVEEAARTLEAGSGDCYSYYSVSKAFFEYFGIENEGIQRNNTAEHEGEGTHFWLVVNLGADKDEWYYYDATRLLYGFGNDNVNQYMMTYEDLRSYDPENKLTYDFYAFNRNEYPPYKRS